MQSKVFAFFPFESISQALHNAKVLADRNLSGFIMVAAPSKQSELEQAVPALIAQHPEVAIGINFRGMGAASALSLSVKMGAMVTWTEEAQVNDMGPTQAALALADSLEQQPGHTLFATILGGLTPDLPPAQAAVCVADLGMIPTIRQTAADSPSALGIRLALNAATVSTGIQFSLALASSNRTHLDSASPSTPLFDCLLVDLQRATDASTGLLCQEALTEMFRSP